MRIIIPRGTIKPQETAVINIPQRLLNRPVLRAVRSQRNIVLDATPSVQESSSLGILNPSQISTQASESHGLLGAEFLESTQGSHNDGFNDWRRSPTASRTYSTPDSDSLGVLDQSQMNEGFVVADRSRRSPQRRVMTTSTSWTRISTPDSADDSIGALRPPQLEEEFNASSLGDQMDMAFLDNTQNSDGLGFMEPALMNSGRSSTIAGEQTRVGMFLSELEEMEFNSMLDTQRS